LHHINTSVQELPEVVTNRQIDQYLLVKGCIIVTFDSPNVFELWEVSQGVETVEKQFEGLVILDSLNNSHDVLNLVAMQHDL
jgi:hypothetical protein